MSPEYKPENESTAERREETEGERWLKLLGREDLIGVPIPYHHEGRQLRAEEFPLLDRERVLPIFTYIESLPPDDPKRRELIEAANVTLDHYLNKPSERIT